MKVCFDTFGCRLNRAEALQMEAAFLARGWQTTEKHSEADLIVVRGCSVTARAERDSQKLVEHLKSSYPRARLIATGCMKEKLNEHILRDVVTDEVPVKTARAYLKVQDGCSGACAFCIVPRFRGSARSVDFTEVCDRAKRFIDAGYREIVVTGCNLSSYSSQGRRLGDLVCAIADLDPACRVRLGSVEPVESAAELVDAIAQNPNICRYLHLAVQSASQMVLSAMRRPYSAATACGIIAKALEKIPDIAIGCDLMSGFPGETDLDHISTRTLFSRYRIAKAHVFAYSERPGTAAASMPGSIPRDVRKARAAELAEAADSSRTRYAKRFTGKVVDVVVEDSKHGAGWTGEYLWCELGDTARPDLKRKERIKIKVLSSNGHMLRGVEA